MLRLALLLASLLAGCYEAPPERLNPGARCAIYLAGPKALIEAGGLPPPHGGAGLFRPMDGAIYINRELPPWHQIMTGQHELTHAILAAPREDPRTVLRLYHSSAYPVCEADAYPVNIPEPRYVGPAQDH